MKSLDENKNHFPDTVHFWWFDFNDQLESSSNICIYLSIFHGKKKNLFIDKETKTKLLEVQLHKTVLLWFPDPEVQSAGEMCPLHFLTQVTHTNEPWGGPK